LGLHSLPGKIVQGDGCPSLSKTEGEKKEELKLVKHLGKKNPRRLEFWAHYLQPPRGKGKKIQKEKGEKIRGLLGEN